MAGLDKLHCIPTS